MATRTKITLHENNDETVSLTITPVNPDEDLTQITSLELYLKRDNCQEDADAELVLTSASATEIDILTQTSDEITALAFIPGSALADPYDRFWHVDGITGAGSRRTAMYGPVEVVSL